MTHSHGSFQKPDAQFIAQINDINAQCHAHQAEWKVDSDWVDKFDRVLLKANSAYTANSNPSTKNALTAATKKIAFGELKHFLGLFVNYFEWTTDVPDAALAAMGLRPRRHAAHLPLPRPDEPPVISVKKQHDEITVYVSRPEYGHPNVSASSNRYYGFELRYKIEGDTQYQMAYSSRLHYTLFFERADEGKRLFLAAAWMNPRLQHGPYCDEISVIIG
ncbi:MAG: hypothetical protein LBU42_08675 [Prevotellaceae bacterium]|jgi:hypothetical protein|nr:hypothetical protein [Prevotellaceae bacterium]